MLKNDLNLYFKSFHVNVKKKFEDSGGM